MPQLTSEAIVLGGIANTLLAGARLFGILQLRDSSKPLPIGIEASRPSLILVTTRTTFVYLLFAALSFAFSSDLVTSRLGIALLFGMGGMLALLALENLIVPEYRRVQSSLIWIVAGFGSLAYLYAAVRGI